MSSVVAYSTFTAIKMPGPSAYSVSPQRQHYDQHKKQQPPPNGGHPQSMMPAADNMRCNGLHALPNEHHPSTHNRARQHHHHHRGGGRQEIYHLREQQYQDEQRQQYGHEAQHVDLTDELPEVKPSWNAVPRSTYDPIQEAAMTPDVLQTAPPDLRLGPAGNIVVAFEFLCRYQSAYLDADHPDHLTAFHCVAEPGLPLQRYLGRLARQAEWDPEGILLALRLCGLYAGRTGMPLSILCAHRLTAAAGTLAVKCHADRFRSNRTVARVAGILLPELNGLELETLKGLGYTAAVYDYEIEFMTQQVALAIVALRSGMFDEAHQRARAAFCSEAPRPADGTEVESASWRLMEPFATADAASGSVQQYAMSQSNGSAQAAAQRMWQPVLHLWHPSAAGDTTTTVVSNPGSA